MRLEHASPESGLKAGLNGTQPANVVDGNAPAFPSALYFQVHFEYIEKLLGEATLCLEALTQQIAESRMGSCTASVDKIEHRFFEQPVTLALQCKGKRRKSARKSAKKVAAGIDTTLTKT